MNRKIQPTEKTLPRIRDTAAPLPRVEPGQVQAALGADAPAEGLAEALAPITLFAVRGELVARLQSSGGRPGLSGTTRRAKIPLSDQEWMRLEELAAAVASPGFAPSAGQVASVLLSLSLERVASGEHASAGGQGRSLVVRELAALAAQESDRRS